MKEQIKRIIDCAQRVGIEMIADEFPSAESISSLTFVSFLVELENEFSIEFPSEYISSNLIQSI